MDPIADPLMSAMPVTCATDFVVLTGLIGQKVCPIGCAAVFTFYLVVDPCCVQFLCPIFQVGGLKSFHTLLILNRRGGFKRTKSEVNLILDIWSVGQVGESRFKAISAWPSLAMHPPHLFRRAIFS